MVEDQVRTEAQATGESSAGGGPQTTTGVFLAILDGLNEARSNPRAVGGLPVTGPPPEREEAPRKPGRRRQVGPKGVSWGVTR